MDVVIYLDGRACLPAEDGIGFSAPEPLEVNPAVRYEISERLGAFQRLFLHVYETRDDVPALDTGFTLEVPTKAAGKGLLGPGREFSLVVPPKGVRIRSHADDELVRTFVLKAGVTYWAEFVIRAKLARAERVVAFRIKTAEKSKAPG